MVVVVFLMKDCMKIVIISEVIIIFVCRNYYTEWNLLVLIDIVYTLEILLLLLKNLLSLQRTIISCILD